MERENESSDELKDKLNREEEFEELCSEDERLRDRELEDS